ncbi:hypothetical protein [Streptomyces aidingensis]|uniref:Uncharacterized protein n=1 Tax=Streptomyces aidingensis TaxID=910347 RepID=A0A1I1FD37_9ACTN|nr:hypothetical protein [Streptomyces aidingensis]SFB97194.1 hypothetical protein SAMN05421773_101685 [Streptomyces aidingensis]
MPHHHAYLWIGPARALHKDGPRRPAQPPLDPAHRAVFEAAEVPPNELAHWLLRPARQIRATFHDPEEAAAWLHDEFAPHLPKLLHPWGDEQQTRLTHLRRRTLTELRHGQCAVWGHYLTGERFFSGNLISCSPHHNQPTLPCPLTTAN